MRRPITSYYGLQWAVHLQAFQEIDWMLVLADMTFSMEFCSGQSGSRRRFLRKPLNPERF